MNPIQDPLVALLDDPDHPRTPRGTAITSVHECQCSATRGRDKNNRVVCPLPAEYQADVTFGIKDRSIKVRKQMRLCREHAAIFRVRHYITVHAMANY